MADRPASAALEEIRAVQQEALALSGPDTQDPPVPDAVEWTVRTAVPCLLGALGSVLELAASAQTRSWEIRDDGRCGAVSWTLDPETVRAAITRAIAGKENSGGDA